MRTVSNLKAPICNLLLLLLPYCCIFSQEAHNPQIRFYTLEDGLSQVSSNDLLLDSSGFVWIATQDGLNKFDGNKFEQYKYDKVDSLTLSGNLTNKLLEDSDGKIWVGTIGNGLNYYDPKLEVFHRIKLEASPHVNEIISALAEDNRKNIWVASRLSGLYKISRTSNGDLVQDLFLEKEISGLLIDDNNTLWIGDTQGYIYKIDPTSEIKSNAKPITQVQGNAQAFYHTENQLLIGGDFGLHIYDIENQQTEIFDLSSGMELPTKHVLAFLKNDGQSVWIGTGSGIYLFDWINQRILKKILYQEDKTNGLSNGTVQALLKISKDQMLVGTANYPNLIDLAAPPFKNISKNQRGDQLLNDNVVFSIYKENDDLWVGTSDGGLNLIRKGRPYYFKFNKNTPNGFSGTVVRAIVKDDMNQRLWIATTRGINMIDLKTFNPDNPKFVVFQYDPANDNSINGDFLKDLVLDHNNNLWGATYGHGIFRLEYSDETNYKIYRYKNKVSDKNSLFNDFSDCITVDKENNLWIGTQSGLSKLSFDHEDYQNPVFTNFSKKENDPSSLVHNSVYDILIDKKDRIWLGTRSGFSQYLGNGKFKSWTQQKQFSNDVVYSIQNDQNGDLWLGTNDGLIKYNPDNDSFKQFNIEDGIQSKEFDIHARFIDPNGTIYLGGIGGVTYFHPNDLKAIDKPQHLYFSDLLVKGKTIKIKKEVNAILNQSLKETTQLKFKHNEFPFFLQFSSIDYRINKNVEYGYKLLPTDTEWIFLKEPEIQFLNLPAGNYTLLVNGFSRGKEWEQAPLQMNLDILPPWWATWWAYIVYIGIAVAFADRFYRFQLSKKMAVAESTRLKDLNEFKNSLYDNITHEFRTPLTVILGMADTLDTNVKHKSFEGAGKSLEMIRRNGKNLLHLVNELLDLAKVESGTMELNLVQTDAIPFVKYLSESFHSLAQAKNINLTVYSEIETLEMDVDVNKIASVISNLLSNAIKFTPAYGKIIVHLNKIKTKDVEFFSLKVQDNGLGLAENDMAHLFDRFYQVDNESTEYQEGTGIGLALAKEFVELMNGTIDVESTLGKGSTFTVLLPITHSAAKTTDAKITIEPPIKAPLSYQKEQIDPSKKSSELPLVLIIEDNDDVAHYLETCLKKNYQTIHARNGDAGIKMALEHIPDIIISDVMMPGKDGYQVCATLKADERTDHIPIILLTAKVTTEDRLTGLTHGADAYLAKPFIKEELFTRLDQLILIRKKLIGKLEKNGLASMLKDKVENPQTKFLQHVIKIIHKNLDNPDFGPSQLAKDMHLSESQIYRKLKAITDKSTAIFIRSVRLQKAKELIQTTQKTISEIAYETGFNDPSWFSRAFKDEFGFPPSDLSK